MLKTFTSQNAPKAVGPYSHGVEHNGLLYCSGVIPLDPKTNEIVVGDVEVQTKRVLENFQIILKDAGVDASNVIKNTLFIKNMEDFAKINELYSQMFSTHKPARSCVEVSRLPKDVLIEMESIVALQ